MLSSQSIPPDRLQKNCNLPLHGWSLAILLLAWLLPGTIGHDPWKTDDAINLGITYRMLTSSEWLLPNLVGEVFPSPPFYFWLAALLGKILSTIPNWLAPHDAMRLASAVCLGTAFFFIYRAARVFFNVELAYTAPLILAGNIGLFVIGHEAQPILAVLAAYCAAFYALAILPQQVIKGAIILGFAIAVGLLSASASLTLPLLLMTLAAPALYPDATQRWRALGALGLTFLTILIIAGPWFAKISAVAPQFLENLQLLEIERFSLPIETIGSNLLGHLTQSSWFAWPALPLAAWSAWLIFRGKCQHGNLSLPGVRLALLGLVLIFIIVGSTYNERNPAAILILPPLALFALPGLMQLRRGAANAFDWLAMMTFSLVIIFAWLGWSGIYFGWPEQLAVRSQELHTGFSASIGFSGYLTAIIALVATIIWIWLIVSRQRSFSRGITHWTAGITVFWLSIATLWLPWIDYGKSYRSVADAIATTLSGEKGCLAASGLSDAQRASFDYFGLVTQRGPEATADRPAGCKLLLLYSSGRNPEDKPMPGWVPLWQGARPGDRTERFLLYRQEAVHTGETQTSKENKEKPDSNTSTQNGDGSDQNDQEEPPHTILRSNN